MNGSQESYNEFLSTFQTFLARFLARISKLSRPSNRVLGFFLPIISSAIGFGAIKRAHLGRPPQEQDKSSSCDGAVRKIESAGTKVI